ncbi:MAG: SOS response-associated peptidase [Caulobacter sp.]|nr:SOS response-associated peptidase [Caulobacter sp.]
MCGRFDTSHLTWAEIYEQLSQFGEVVTAPVNLQPDDDVRPTTTQLVARQEEGRWVLEKMRWGLVPFWRGGKPLKDTEKGRGDGFKLTTFNARTETVASAATFRGAFARRRCLIPASAWYEWTGPAGGKTRHRFSRADGQALWFAGIWDHCETPDAGLITSFTILTAPSEGWLTEFHTRAPVILEPADWAGWLDVSQDTGPLMAAVRPDRVILA